MCWDCERKQFQTLSGPWFFFFTILDNEMLAWADLQFPITRIKIVCVHSSFVTPMSSIPIHFFAFRVSFTAVRMKLFSCYFIQDVKKECKKLSKSADEGWDDG